MVRILVTGCLGQIGTEFVPMLRKEYGDDNVIATDVRMAPKSFRESGPYLYLNVTDKAAFTRIVVDYNIDWIVHNASILSAAGEKNPDLAEKVNIGGTKNALELGKMYKLRVLIPSSIAAFGPTTPKDNTPNVTIMEPNTMYGITKIYTELMGSYYQEKFGVDFRTIRYPGIISNKALPGGGTTDYAVDIFYEALDKNVYTCFLREDCALPMMYMPDCLRATFELLTAPEEKLTTRAYNLAGVSFTAGELAAEVAKLIPGFKCDYVPDFRQAIADTWPRSIDDSLAQKDWGWKIEYGLKEMAADMVDALKKRLGK